MDTLTPLSPSLLTFPTFLALSFFLLYILISAIWPRSNPNPKYQEYPPYDPYPSCLHPFNDHHQTPHWTTPPATDDDRLARILQRLDFDRNGFNRPRGPRPFVINGMGDHSNAHPQPQDIQWPPHTASRQRWVSDPIFTFPHRTPGSRHRDAGTLFMVDDGGRERTDERTRESRQRRDRRSSAE
ncbi:hypothetical protein P154DRAFT_582772 [Amniculicola lignicola CBS 123094]|uniref:Uncharacterized protein n=1 Tax=Amniculicola lignicola CBS 123094 TaxID=1392246 RepID=A0A6A5W2V6_9PLEO|nr:hypothetical protein P154DRAFT_582772 [Amniculicola lignicola CBS 123094]